MAGEVTEAATSPAVEKAASGVTELRHFYFSYHEVKLNSSQMQGFSWLTPGKGRVLTAPSV